MNTRCRNVKGPHFIAVLGDGGISRDVADGNLPEGVDGKDHNLKGGVQGKQLHQAPAPAGKLAFREIHREHQQAQQHHVNGDEEDAGHDGHTQVLVKQNADEVADVHHRRPGAGVAQVAAGGPVFLEGFDCQKRVYQRDDNGNFYVPIQNHRTHIGNPFLPGGVPGQIAAVFFIIAFSFAFFNGLGGFCRKKPGSYAPAWETILDSFPFLWYTDFIIS